jgi:3-dehydroquinate dehydratase-2
LAFYAVILGANLNTLGTRSPEYYGTLTVAEISERLKSKAREIGCDVEVIQSNSEAELIEWIQGHASDLCGMLVNPGGFTRFGQALCDAVVDVGCPWLEIHMSNIHARGIPSIWSEHALGQITGLHWRGYLGGLEMLNEVVNERSQAVPIDGQTP